MIDACIVGAAKCGTTSLAGTLSLHGQINFSRIKETQYFWPKPLLYKGPADPSWIKNSPDNNREFLELLDSQKDYSCLKMEASGYISNPGALRNLYNANPEIKLILVLRDPIERAISAYRHLRRDGYETLDFAKALSAEEDRIRMDWGPLYWYRKLSDYQPQVEFLLALFRREQVHFVLLEKLIENPENEIREVESFLGLKHVKTEFRKLNPGMSVKSTPLARTALATLSFARVISHHVLPRTLSGFLGKHALALSHKHFTEKITVGKEDVAPLRELYRNTALLEKLTHLPCKQCWNYKKWP